MLNRIAHITLFVGDLDETLAFYTNRLGFAKVVDKKLAPGIRWVAVAPSDANETVIVFEKASNEKEQEMIGKQLTNMLITIETDDFDRTYQAMKEKGVEFVEEPTEAPWGKQAVFRDLYGNLFDLLERRR